MFKVSITEGLEKSLNGQYFTMSNCFSYKPFMAWLEEAKAAAKGVAIEPFAGAGNIMKMIPEISFSGFDIEPQGDGIQQRDTIKNFPEGFKLCITNPPYLAKNSAKRKGEDTSTWSHDDLYKTCLEVCLKNCDYVAAIIPESFITSSFEKDRLVSVISLTEIMFEDTDCPVCLALFSPEKKAPTEVYRKEEYLGVLEELKPSWGDVVPNKDIKFNDPQGILGFRGIDGTSTNSISFIMGEEIPSDSIKVSSRALTRITHPGITKENVDSVIGMANKLIEGYRDNTKDVGLTPFKGLRKDGLFRRRMDFSTARMILSQVLLEKDF